MKTLFRISLLVLFLQAIPGYANEGFTYNKQKTINKAYIVNSDAGLAVDNSYGNIFVTTWNEDKIEIEVLIKVSGNDEKWVNERLASIDVSISALKSLVSAKTVFEHFSSRNNAKSNNFEINYTVKIPKNGTVSLNNKYGNIGASDLNSSTEFNCKYGNINLSKLNGNSNLVTINYCSNSTIESAKNLTVNAKYSNLKVESVNKLNLESDYSEIQIGTADNVKYNSKFGSVKIRQINKLEAEGNYLTINVGLISKDLDLSCRYSQVNIGSIGPKASNINIATAYTGVSIGYNASCSFDYDLFVRFGDIKYDKELRVSSNEKSTNSKRISGSYGIKGQNKLNISASYGNVKLLKKEH